VARSADEIYELYDERRIIHGPVLLAMVALRDTYNGDIILPLPELDRQERPAVANLVQQALDAYGQRIGSVMPMLHVPALNTRSEASLKRASVRRDAVLGWWEHNELRMKLRRRARHLVGYACSPVIINPDYKTGTPRWDVRDPLTTYPAPTLDPDELVPEDVIFAYQRTYAKLRREYGPEAVARLHINQPTPRRDEKFTVLEYVDAEEKCVVAISRAPDYPHNVGNYPYDTNDHRTVRPVALDWMPNRAGCPTAIVPGRITLDRPMGQFDGILGMYQTQAKLMALDVIHTQKSVFPDLYLISRPGEQARFVSGPHPGYTGEVNEIQGGDIKQLELNPSFAVSATMDRLERAQRLSGGIASEFGGESATNIRTGARGERVMSAIVDYPVQEAQEMLAASLVRENRVAVAVAKGYFGDQRKSFLIDYKGKVRSVDYVPNKDFAESDVTRVSYPMAGADLNNLVVSTGQMVGTGMMSQRTAREKNPLIDDPEGEHDRVTTESLERALLTSIEQQAAAGTIPPADLARIMQLVSQDMPLAKAVETAQQEAQERQAQVVPAGAPEAQPGLAAPGMGAEATGMPEPQGVAGLQALLGSLGGTPTPAGVAA